ncbi:olfactory receptor 1019-like [Spea bombifrons]|uniref:olfactory receptor 1019-like n=1 Tax=Spea bombifrons TaxID=233779 RepID=UPI00234A459C|nr:olfactory receptor 1019-like [Spea bombifrons]
MEEGNRTSLTYFILVGLTENPGFQPFLFAVFLCFYVVTVSGNTCIILAYRLCSALQTPMYFCLANFSFIEICYVSTIVPKTLANFLAEHKTISFRGCALQMYFGFLFGGAECYMLAALGYDRYNAICFPLLYNTIMSRKACLQLVLGSYLIAAGNALVHNVLTFALPFCGSNRINHFCCDVPPILELACADTRINEAVLFGLAGCVIIGSFVFIMFSYIKIISAVLSMRSTSGRKKAFSTCTSHFMVVAIFYGSAIFMYFRPKSAYSMYQDRLASVMYTVIAPLLNPFIYTLRNNDIKVALIKLIGKKSQRPKIIIHCG